MGGTGMRLPPAPRCPARVPHGVSSGGQRGCAAWRPQQGDREGNIPATEIIRDRHGNGGAIKARFSWEQLCALYLP